MSRLARWILSLLLLSPCCAGAQVVNFDDVPDGTDISTHYPGLTFSCAGTHCASPSIFARVPTQTFQPTSPLNMVAPQQTGPPLVHNPTTGTIKIAITCPATKVTVKARSTHVPEYTEVQHAILVWMDGNVVKGQAVGTQDGQWELLTVSSNSPNTPIKTVFLGVEGQGEAADAWFDDLTVECARERPKPIWRGFPLIIYWKPVLATALVVGLVVVVVIRRRLKRP